jgi:hypothetical protein
MNKSPIFMCSAQLFRLTLTLQSGQKLRGFGFFVSRDEALQQTWADYPEAGAVNAVQLTGRAGS